MVDVVVGDEATCLRDAEGRVRCFGRNDTAGELGLGPNVSESLAPIEVPLPQPVEALFFDRGALRTSFGAYRNTGCARTTDGRMYCWGWNHGLYGDARRIRRRSPRSMTCSRSASPEAALVV